MRLEVEIKDGEWKFSYKIGESSHTATRHVDADSLVAFVGLLQYASKAADHDREEQWTEIKSGAWIERNVEKAKEILARVERNLPKE
jgi:hypothetical protein